MDGVFDAALTSTGVAGLSAAVWIGDQEWTRTAGYADLETQEPFDPAAHVRIASITKTFTATAVLILVDRGELALDDVLESYVPGIANGDRITVEDMLGMRSGVFDYTSDPGFLARFDADPTASWSDEQTVAVIRANPPAFAPGEQVVYADSNYALLGMVIEAVTAVPAGEFITSEVIERLDLPDTSYPTTTRIPDPHPTGYLPQGTLAAGQPFDNEADPPEIVDELNPALAGTAGAMISTLADLKVWGTELTDGSLLAPSTHAARLGAIRQITGQKINVGYGLGILGLNEFLGHDGAILGFSSVVMRRPETDTTIVMVANESTNSTTPTFEAALEVIKALYPDQVR
nr:serine hydrolase domain-containing protein [Nakamurella flavida]